MILRFLAILIFPLLLPCAAMAASSGCGDFRPKDAEDEKAVTLVSAHVAENGTVSNAQVERSSGYPALDQAAIACLDHAFIGAHTSGGKPIAFDWGFYVRWTKWPYSWFVRENPAPQRCMGRPFADGTVEMKYVIAADGSVQDMAVENSSGNTALDDYAMKCYATVHYPSPMQDGKPIAIDWRVRWNSHTH
jgi:TonB family protein